MRLEYAVRIVISSVGNRVLVEHSTFHHCMLALFSDVQQSDSKTSRHS